MCCDALPDDVRRTCGPYCVAHIRNGSLNLIHVRLDTLSYLTSPRGDVRHMFVDSLLVALDGVSRQVRCEIDKIPSESSWCGCFVIPCGLPVSNFRELISCGSAGWSYSAVTRWTFFWRGCCTRQCVRHAAATRLNC